MSNTTPSRWAALAAGGFAATTLVGSVATPNSGSDIAARLEVLSHSWLIGNVTYLCRMADAVLLLPMLIIALRLLRRRGIRLGVAAAALLAVGHVAGAGVVTIMAVQINVLAPAPDRPAAVAVTELIERSALFQILCVLYLTGLVLGFLLLGIALWRARTIPRWAAAGIGLGLVLHISAGDLRWTAVSGSLLLTAGLVMLAITAVHPVTPPGPSLSDGEGPGTAPRTVRRAGSSR